MNFDLKIFSNFLKDLQVRFDKRFKDFESQDNFNLFSNPFLIKKNNLPEQFQNEIIDMRKLNLEVEFNKCLSNDDKIIFFKHLPDQFFNFKNNSLKILSMFPSSYLCEQYFSMLKFRKNQCSSFISPDNLKSCLRIACSDSKPNYQNLINQ